MGAEPYRLAFLGIDPGLSGGLALLRDSASYYGPLIELWKMPETETDISELFRKIAPEVLLATIEAVHSMPGQGVASTFKFGKNYGFLRGLLVGFQIPFREVTPARWQKTMECLSKGDKNVTKARAQQLFPFAPKITHATADALLIAEYCRTTYITNRGMQIVSGSVWDAL